MNIRKRKHIVLAMTLLALLLTIPIAAFAEVEEYIVGVDGMACPFCAYGIEKKLQEIEGVDNVEIRIKDGEVDVPTTGTVAPAQIDTAIEKAGFGLRDLRLRGTGDVTVNGSSEIAFSPELSLPLDGFKGESGRYRVEGDLAKSGDRWVLNVTKSQRVE